MNIILCFTKYGFRDFVIIFIFVRAKRCVHLVKVVDLDFLFILEQNIIFANLDRVGSGIGCNLKSFNNSVRREFVKAKFLVGFEPKLIF